jgi:uncharacterized DUF497 family protein
MDVYIEIFDIKFYWHDKKLHANELNHDGISLEQAIDVFLDPDAMYTSPGEGHKDGRQALIGKTRQAASLFVVMVEESDSDVIFISARHATPVERKRYEARLY